MHRHNRTVWAESILNEGTYFYFSLPALAGLPNINSKPMDYNDIEILFAEDSEDDAILTMRALKKSGLDNKLHHVKDGAEALD